MFHKVTLAFFFNFFLRPLRYLLCPLREIFFCPVTGLLKNSFKALKTKLFLFN